MNNSKNPPWETFEEYAKRIEKINDPLVMTLEVINLIHEMVKMRVDQPLMSLDEIGEEIIFSLEAIRAGIETAIKDKQR